MSQGRLFSYNQFKVNYHRPSPETLGHISMESFCDGERETLSPLLAPFLPTEPPEPLTYAFDR